MILNTDILHNRNCTLYRVPSPTRFILHSDQKWHHAHYQRLDEITREHHVLQFQISGVTDSDHVGPKQPSWCIFLCSRKCCRSLIQTKLYNFYFFLLKSSQQNKTGYILLGVRKSEFNWQYLRSVISSSPGYIKQWREKNSAKPIWGHYWHFHRPNWAGNGPQL